MKSGTKVGELAVWNVVNPPHEPHLYPVATPKEAKELIDHLIAEQLQNNAIWGNAFGLVEWDGYDWYEWYDENGEDIRSDEVTL